LWSGLDQDVLAFTFSRRGSTLSVASVVTLSAYVALLTIGGRDANLPWGLLVALGLGLVVGSFNAAPVVRLRVPAIIATLATGDVLATATLLCNRSIHGFAVSPTLRAISAGRFLDSPIMILVCLGLIALTEFILRRTVYGRTLSAVGQNRIAARLAGIPVDRVIATAFVISSVLASLMGVILGANVGGAVFRNGPALSSAIGRRGGDRRHAHSWRLGLRNRCVLRQRFADPVGYAHANHAAAARLAGYGARSRRHPRAGASQPRRNSDARPPESRDCSLGGRELTRRGREPRAISIPACSIALALESGVAAAIPRNPDAQKIPRPLREQSHVADCQAYEPATATGVLGRTCRR
jgi:Branched-chain amino acid transport system / permease component